MSGKNALAMLDTVQELKQSAAAPAAYSSDAELIAACERYFELQRHFNTYGDRDTGILTMIRRSWKTAI
jgi:hypothetical protein